MKKIDIYCGEDDKRGGVTDIPMYIKYTDFGIRNRR